MQKTAELKTKLVERVEDEKKTLQKQFEKLVKELKENSDSESADEIDQKVKQVELKQHVAILEGRLKNRDSPLKLQIEEAQKALEVMQAQYDYSCRANASLREDYDLLQGKLDKTMKTANNQVSDRNE